MSPIHHPDEDAAARRPWAACLGVLLILPASAVADHSRCYGTTAKGRLSNATALPIKGKNFRIFTPAAAMLGRNFVHHQVKSVVIKSFQALARSHPRKRFMYADTGWRGGGKFPPHRSHQNGLSVDFMAPVTVRNQTAWLPVHVSNKYGYAIEFDRRGRFKEFRLDFEAMAAHLKSLHHHALQQGLNIKRVFFDPRLQPLLWDTADGAYLKKHIRFNKKQAWVRHDEHYHVDFKLSCRPFP